MENAPRTAFSRARPVARTSFGQATLVLQPEQLLQPPDPFQSPGAWLIAAVAAETRIMTPTGPCPAGRLQPSDFVQTIDHGPVPVLWSGRRTVSARQVAACPQLGPILVPRAAFGGGTPRRPVRLSPRAGVLLSPDNAPDGVLVPAGDLCGHAGIAPTPAEAVTYVQLLLERHAVIAADGLPVESFHPGWLDDGPWNSRLRAEVIAVLPDLEHGPDLYGPDVRPRVQRAR
ncbi:Hint domain-containing protein [Tropicimonas isoalkanivorans]|uniref:Hint domain-containing protein n=1 Tax=Tropicimonas isoalkanivorans TaxID=441112 RepID=A0A1I1DJQ7_9RHOB|nr:Hint domain-containing protein [Tropicimonas isoalkanivorans]SFB75064.1 Hint domain-containing protein [Tropicimonas isoalkanivorans]